MDINIFYLELMFILINFYQHQNLMKKDILAEILFLRKKTRSTRKKLGCKFIRINTSNAKNCYDLDYEVGNIEALIDEFKNKKTRRQNKRKRRRKSSKKIKELEAKLKELEDKNKNPTTNQITNNFGKIIIKN